MLSAIFQQREIIFVNYVVFPNSFRDIVAYYRKSSTKDAFLCSLLKCFLNLFHLMIEFIKHVHSINERIISALYIKHILRGRALLYQGIMVLGTRFVDVWKTSWAVLLNCRTDLVSWYVYVVWAWQLNQ